MNFKTIALAALFSLAFAATASAAENSVQVVSFSEMNQEETSIELTGSKVITDDFSFKIPESWSGACTMVSCGDNYEIYDTTLYETDGSGLLLSIYCFRDVDYSDLEDCAVLGFCEDRTYILDSHFEEIFTDSSSAEYKACKEASALLKKSFVSYIKEPAA